MLRIKLDGFRWKPSQTLHQVFLDIEDSRNLDG